MIRMIKNPLLLLLLLLLSPAITPSGEASPPAFAHAFAFLYRKIASPPAVLLLLAPAIDPSSEASPPSLHTLARFLIAK